MKTVLCFGNEFVKEDSLAKQLADEIKIKGVEFVKCNSVDVIFDYKLDEVFILDVANVDKVVAFDDLGKLKAGKITTLHDFDLGFFLKLLKELKQIKKIRIIAIPQEGDKEKIKGEIEKILIPRQHQGNA